MNRKNGHRKSLTARLQESCSNGLQRLSALSDQGDEILKFAVKIL